VAEGFVHNVSFGVFDTIFGEEQCSKDAEIDMD